MQHALEYVKEKFEEDPSRATNTVLFSDSLSGLQTMESGDLDESTTKVLALAEKIKASHQVGLVLQWIPGHTNLFGNEKADALAKKGSKLAQPTRPVTLQTTKQKIKQNYKKDWMRKWASGPTARKVYNHMNQVNPNDNLQKLKRKDQTTIFRLRTQHIPLNYHLNRFNPEKPPHCVLCDDPYETVEHVLLECRKLEDLRKLYLPTPPSIENTLYCSLSQLERTVLFYDMTCVRRANAQRLLD